MPDIEVELGDAFFDAYNEGREDGARYEGMDFGVSSAILDNNTCDFCTWADNRSFEVAGEHLLPPYHFNCRCIVAYYTADMLEEDELDIEQLFLPWDEPPSSAFPIGARTKGKQ